MKTSKKFACVAAGSLTTGLVGLGAALATSNWRLTIAGGLLIATALVCSVISVFEQLFERQDPPR